jgi:nucleoside-diphosphate-sugar epimerase
LGKTDREFLYVEDAADGVLVVSKNAKEDGGALTY